VSWVSWKIAAWECDTPNLGLLGNVSFPGYVKFPVPFVVSQVRLLKSGSPVLSKQLVPEGNWYRLGLDT